MIRKQKADSKGSRNMSVFSPPRSREGPPPYDSERMPSRPDFQFSNYDTVFFQAGGLTGPAQSRIYFLLRIALTRSGATVLVAHPNYRPPFEAMQQQLNNVGIRCRLEVPEHGSHASMFVAGKFRGIGTGTGPYWSGITHPGVAGQTHITGTWSHNLATPAVKKAMGSLMRAVGDTAVAERASELDNILKQEMVRVPLWSIHQAYAAGPKIQEFRIIPGIQHPIGFEFLKVKDK